jgi:putative hydrolase of the HAD superfamily
VARVAPLTGPRALIVDFGGVLTSPLQESMAAWCRGDGVDPAEFRAVIKQWLTTPAGEGGERNPVHALERGELPAPDFERALAARLRTADGRPLDPAGLLDRIFAGLTPAPEMVEAVRRAKAAGCSTALLSNSWGNQYPRDGWSELFDAVVISGEVQLRKPDPDIFALTALRLGLPPGQCVFVDDLESNVRGADAVGMVGVHHVTASRTLERLQGLLGVDLRG